MNKTYRTFVMDPSGSRIDPTPHRYLRFLPDLSRAVVVRTSTPYYFVDDLRMLTITYLHRRVYVLSELRRAIVGVISGFADTPISEIPLSSCFQDRKLVAELFRMLPLDDNSHVIIDDLSVVPEWDICYAPYTNVTLDVKNATSSYICLTKIDMTEGHHPELTESLFPIVTNYFSQKL